MTIYIATLGDLTNWFQSDYIIDDKKKAERVYSTVFAYKDVSKIILVVNDSTIYAKSLKSEPAVTCYKDVVSPPPYNSYLEIQSIVEKYVECVMSNVENEAKKYNQIESVLPKLKIISLPAIGTFSMEKNGITTKFGVIATSNGTIIPPARYYSNLTETLLINSLYEELKKANEDVVLDITHGFNYLPTLTFYAIYKLVSLLGLRLKAINFIPVGKRNDEKGSEIRIYSQVDIVSTTNKELKFDIDQINEEKIDNDLNRGIIMTLKYNAPLALVYFCQLRKEGLNDYYSQFVKAVSIVSINEKENEIRIDKEKIKWIESNDEIWGDVIADYVCKKVNDLATKFNCDEGYYDIKILVKLAENVFSRFSSISENIIKNEYSNIYSIVSEIKEPIEKMYSELRKSNIKTTDYSDTERIKRNYMAHAGLLSEITKIKKTNEGKICIKYANPLRETFSAVYGKGSAKLIFDIL